MAVAAEAATEPAEQCDDEDDDQDESSGDIMLSFPCFGFQRAPSSDFQATRAIVGRWRRPSVAAPLPHCGQVTCRGCSERVGCMSLASSAHSPESESPRAPPSAPRARCVGAWMSAWNRLTARTVVKDVVDTPHRHPIAEPTGTIDDSQNEEYCAAHAAYRGDAKQDQSCHRTQGQKPRLDPGAVH
jgi:hypothetical protein